MFNTGLLVMPVYIDSMNAPLGRMKMCHMIADAESELEDMANKIGINLNWWQYKGTSKSHFDVCLSKKRKAIENGAIEVSSRELIRIKRNRYEKRRQ